MRQNLTAWAHSLSMGACSKGLLSFLRIASTAFAVLWSACAPAQTCTTMISTLPELQSISQNLSGNYCLTQNINASATATTPFVPIGTDTSPFSGTFDGRGFVIDQLRTTTSSVYIGLFGYVGTGGQIRNVNLTNANIATSTSLPTNRFVGTLAGWNDGTITQSSSSGSLGTFGHAFATVGALVGGN